MEIVDNTQQFVLPNIFLNKDLLSFIFILEKQL